MKKIMVTGGAGFIGSNFIRFLLASEPDLDIYNLDLLTYAGSLENLKSFDTGVLCHQAVMVKRKIAPKYDSRYTYKGELNWYFDIFKNKPDLSCFHHEVPFVYYFLGGKGYQDFLRNRVEWYKLLIRRFGIRSVLNRHFLKFIARDFQNRYGFFKSK